MNEALDLCAAYQIQGEEYASGRAKPARVAAMVPWLRCFETVFRKFPASKDRESFVMLFRAMEARHDGAAAIGADIPDWPAMNFAVTHAVDHIKNPALSFTDEERRAIERQFPGYGIYLAESGQFSKSAPGSVRSSPLDEIRGEIEGRPAGRPGTIRADDAEKLPPRPLPMTEEQKEYCKRYKAYRMVEANAEELGAYERVLDEHTYEDAGNANERALRERVTNRLASLKKEAQGRKTALDRDLDGLRARSKWFRNGYCLQSSARLQKAQ